MGNVTGETTKVLTDLADSVKQSMQDAVVELSQDISWYEAARLVTLFSFGPGIGTLVALRKRKVPSEEQIQVVWGAIIDAIGDLPSRSENN